MKADSKRVGVYSCGCVAFKIIVFAYRFAIKMAWMLMNDFHALFA